MLLYLCLLVHKLWHHFEFVQPQSTCELIYLLNLGEFDKNDLDSLEEEENVSLTPKDVDEKIIFLAPEDIELDQEDESNAISTSDLTWEDLECTISTFYSPWKFLTDRCVCLFL